MKNANPNPEAEQNGRSSNLSRTIISITAGAVAGAAAALLLAPQSGAETRRTIGNKANKVTNDLKDTVQQGINKINSKVAEVEEMIHNSTAPGKKMN